MSKNKPRKLTVDEAREKFILTLWHLVDYWDKTPDQVVDGFGGYIKQGQRERLEGLMHSILASIDGNTLSMPGMELRPIVPKTDIDYHKEWGDNWFPPKVDIGGSLHEIMYPIGKKYGFVKEIERVKK